MTALTVAPSLSGAVLPLGLTGPRRVLMTLDAVGGVWRYAIDLASALVEQDYSFVFAGFGPAPDAAQRAEAEALGTLIWLDAPLDWTAQDETELDPISGLIADLVEARDIDLVHLNLPSQAAGLALDVPVLVVSHSCVVTWFSAVRGGDVPPDWAWQIQRNRAGFDAADVVVAPSKAHADALRRCYGAIDGLTVVYNGSDKGGETAAKQPLVFAAGRWWDEGKNGVTLDSAAASSSWPVMMAGPLVGVNGEGIILRHALPLGPLSHAETLAHMARAAIVVSPSLYEPFGLAPLEAARCGAALILADNPTYREIWNGAALFAAPDDPDAFAHAIARLAENETLRAGLAEAARRRAAFFTLDRQQRTMSALYGQLLDFPLARRSA